MRDPYKGGRRGRACMPFPQFDGPNETPVYGAPFQEGGSSSSAGFGAPLPPVAEVPVIDITTSDPEVRVEEAGDSVGCKEPKERKVHFSEEEDVRDLDDPDSAELGAGEVSVNHLLTHKPADTTNCETCNYEG